MSTLGTITEIEAAIVARLAAVCGDLVERVYTAAETSQIAEELQQTPNFTVLYNGLRPAGEISGGVVQGVVLSYLVVACVKSARLANRSTDAREAVGRMVDAALEALINFRPTAGSSILRLVDGPAPNYSETGFVYYPIGFEIVRTYRGKPA